MKKFIVWTHLTRFYFHPPPQDLENELESVRNQIKEKSNVLETRTTGIANLCENVGFFKNKNNYPLIKTFKQSICLFLLAAQIMELSEKIVPLQEEISDLKQTYSENLAGKTVTNILI